jgi:hypothetical protein
MLKGNHASDLANVFSSAAPRCVQCVPSVEKKIAALWNKYAAIRRIFKCVKAHHFCRAVGETFFVRFLDKVVIAALNVRAEMLARQHQRT